MVLLPCIPGSVMLLPWRLQSALQAQALHPCCILSYLFAANFSNLLACCKLRAFPPGLNPVSTLQRDVASVSHGPAMAAVPWCLLGAQPAEQAGLCMHQSWLDLSNSHPYKKMLPDERRQAALGAAGVLNGAGGTTCTALPASVQAVSAVKHSNF